MSAAHRAGGRAVAALVALTVLWGYTWIVAKQALDYAGPFEMGALRTACGVLSLFATLLLLRRSLAIQSPGRTAVIGVFQTTGFIALSSWALVEGGAGKTSVLIFTMPIWSLLLGRWLLGERVRGSQWIAVGSAMLGLTLIIAPWQLGGSASSKLLAVLAAVSWGVSAILVKRWRADLSRDVLVLTAWQMLFGVLGLIAIAAAVPERPFEWSPPFFAILAFLALISTALGWYLWLYVLERLPVWQASLSMLGIPAVANALSRWMLDERATPGEMMGMALIAVGLTVMSYLNWRAQRRLVDDVRDESVG